MPNHDYRCPRCGHTEVDVKVKLEQLAYPRGCVMCDSKMDRLPAAPAFAVKGFSAANGYSKK